MNLTSHLTQLEAAQLLHRLGEEELSYIFKHVLVQDTAYRSLLKQDRKRLHRLVGETLEAAYSGQLDEIAGLLAQHFAEAGDCDKAIVYARQAARRTLARYAFEEAVHQLEIALTWIEPDPNNDAHLALIEEAGDANRLLRKGERTLALYQQAIDLWNRRVGGGRLNIVRLYSKIIQTVIDIKYAVKIDLMQRANEFANDSCARLEVELKEMQGAPPHVEVVHGLTALAIGAWRLPATPNWDAAEKFARDAVAAAEQLSHPEILSHALDALAGVYDGRGRLREHLQVALQRWTATQDAGFDSLREKIDTQRGVGMAHMYLGEYAQALPPLQEAESLAETVQAIDLQTFALGIQAQCLFRLDHWDEVLEIEKKWRVLEQTYPRERVGLT